MPSPQSRDDVKTRRRPQDHADRLLPEATLVGVGDLVETREILGIAGQHDQHDLAELADDLLAGRVPPLAGGVEHGQPVRKTRRDLVIEELNPLRLAHGDVPDDPAPEGQLGDLLRFLGTAAFRRLGPGGAGQGNSQHYRRNGLSEDAHREFLAPASAAVQKSASFWQPVRNADF